MIKEIKMNKDTINCPECGTDISVEKVIASEIERSIRSEYMAKAKVDEKKLKEKEAELTKRDESISFKEQSIEVEVNKRLAADSVKFKEQVRKELEPEFSVRITSLSEELGEYRNKVMAGEKREMELLKKEKILKEEIESNEIFVARKISEERSSIIANAKRKYSEEHDLKDLEKDRVITEQKKQLDQMQQKLEQGSMQIQGDVQEVNIENTLKVLFPIDEIEPVKPGSEGADVIHKITNSMMQNSGKILWESKNTKSFNRKWISKLKDDQVTTGADVAVLVTKALPDGIVDFCQIDSVWVINRQLISPVSQMLRNGLIQTTAARNSAIGMDEKMKVLHRFLTGPEFKQRMEIIIQTFVEMQQELETEKRSLKRQWKKREKSINRVLDNTAGLWGDFQGLLGASIEDIKELEMSQNSESDIFELTSKVKS
jgi:hypothetical protein